MYNTIDELIDAHNSLFEDGAELYSAYQSGSYKGIEDEYHAQETEIRAKMALIDAQIESIRNPPNHE